MLQAIDIAAGRRQSSGLTPPCTRAAGLRVIREFEAANGFAFDPFDQEHLYVVRGKAWYFVGLNRIGNAYTAAIKKCFGSLNSD
jgi:hypothetical protein